MRSTRINRGRRRGVRGLGLVLVVLCAAGPPLALAGCWDLREIEAFVHAGLLAIDKGIAPGAIRLTALILTPPSQPGASDAESSSGGGMQAITATAEGPSFYVASERLRDVTDRAVAYTHLEAIVFGDDLARDGLTPVFDALTRSREIRRSVQVVLADEVSGQEVLETVRGNVERAPTAYIGGLTARHDFETGRSVEIRLHDLDVAFSEPGQEIVIPLISPAPKPPAPVPPGQGGGGGSGGGSSGGGGSDGGSNGGGGSGGGSSGGSSGGGSSGGGGGQAPEGGGEATGQMVAPTEKRVAITGLAVFRSERMVGKLSPDQTLAYLMTVGHARQVTISLGGSATDYAGLVVRLFPTSRALKVKRNGSQVDIDLGLRVQATILEITSPVQAFDPANLAEVRNLLAADIQRRVTEVINLAKTEAGGDIFDFSLSARRTFRTWAEWNDFDWHGAFRAANVTIRVDVSEVRTNLIFQPFAPGQ